MRQARVTTVAGRWLASAQGPALTLTLLAALFPALILLPLCPAQHCNHSCCPDQSQHCPTFDASVITLCAHAPEVLRDASLSWTAPVQSPVHSGERLYVANVEVLTKAPPGPPSNGPAAVPLRI